MSPPFESPHFQFMLACLSDLDKATTTDVTEVDWPAFVAALKRQQVLSFVVFRTQDTPVQSLIPKPVWRQMRVRAAVNAAKAQSLALETLSIDDALERAGVPRIHYKGAIWAARFYDDITLREFGDVDLLFQPERRDELLEALAGIGYESKHLNLDPYLLQFDKDLTLLKDGFMLEPHWSITASRIRVQLDYAELWRHAVDFNFNGRVIRTFSLEHALIIMCVGGAKAQWQRLQMFTDIAQLVRTSRTLDWQRVMREAENWGCATMAKIGLRFCVDYLELEVPDDVLAWIDSDFDFEQHLRWVQRALTTDPDDIWSAAGPATYHPFIRQMHEGWWNKWVYTVRSITSPTSLHARRFRLPNVLRWLYPMIVPVHDYCVLPLVRRWRTRTSV